eukprot:TRINITY_DN2428_c0_g1_i1.p1 TRINITY_DN2428_c0_g1~~TRINITY_DN2428_c0_g1_i1.p1  ORF type:complete len:1093 (+),score=254.33 TRINITY_DN2428_c0_g1_i1:94-3372(+)
MAKPELTKATWKKALKQEGVDDMTLLAKLKNEEISSNLRLRHQHGIIYTYIGPVLISVNPFRNLDIYSDEILREYGNRSRTEMPPHVYAISEESYRNMMNEQEHQCIIISGESGAGKTEAAKKIVHYISEISGKSSGVDKIKQVMMESNPVLEGFGNAKTLRNNNSSRFGKYFVIGFDKQGNPCGGKITTYLLEKSRVVYQAEGERNYHIFYQFARGHHILGSKDYEVLPPEQYFYTNQSGCMNVDGMDDVKEFKDTVRAMNVIGITAEEQKAVFRCIAAILWLGNIKFIEENSVSQIQDKKVLAYVAFLIGVDAVILERALISRLVETKRGGNRSSSYNVPLNAIQAGASRDALAKAIYDRLFLWLIERINRAMVSTSTHLTIGVLDIYGFEIFKKNGFEQLCINYVNEKLQQLFIELTLKQEQEEYVREGIKWTPIQYFNNKVVCDLIEGKKPPGVFAILDDACSTAHAEAEGADRNLVQRLGACSSHPHFNLRANAFCVKHYAGDVVYDIEGMTGKNKDTLFNDLLEVTQMSNIPFLVALFPDKIDPDSRKKPTTAGHKIRESAQALFDTLIKCQPHYIRCIKPNDEKRSDLFDEQRVGHQVKYLGLLENIRVRRAGFAYRAPFEKFLKRFYLLSTQTSYAGEFIWKGDGPSGTRVILTECGIDPAEWQMGSTKVFIRHPETLDALEDMKEKYWHNMAARIQRAYRNLIEFYNRCASVIQNAYRSWKALRPNLEMRNSSTPLLQGKKERRRFSLISNRRFYGDYLHAKANPAIFQAIGAHLSANPVIFSFRCESLTQRTLRSTKLSARTIVVTRKSVILLKAVREGQVISYQVDREVALSSITGVSLSCNQDDYIVLHVANDADIVLDCDFKTELTTILYTQLSKSLPVKFSNKIEYKKKKDKTTNIVFAKDEMKKISFLDQGMFKDDTVLICTGMPATSVPKQPWEIPTKKASASSSATKSSAPKSVGATSAAASAPKSVAAASTVASAPKTVAATSTTASAPKTVATTSAPTAKVGPPPSLVPPKPPAAPKPKQVRALYNYEPQQSDELSIRVGDIITVLLEDESGWWEGELKGNRGVFPSNYVQPI